MTGIITAAVVVAGSAVYSVSQQRKANKEQKKANELAKRQENVRALRERQQAVRQQQIANSAALAAGTNSGISNSSLVSGATGAFNSQTAANVSFIDQMNQLTVQRMDRIQRADTYLGRAAMGQQVGQLATTLAGLKN